jgi:hypothetical protein
MKHILYYPTYGEILTIERAARRAQAVEMIRLAALAASKLKALSRQFAVALSRAFDQPAAPATRSRHGNSGAPATLVSIMEELGASLPDELRTRYAEELATAARVAPAIDFGLAAWDFTVRVLAGAFQGIAQSLRAGAWCLDAVARRLMPLH